MSVARAAAAALALAACGSSTGILVDVGGPANGTSLAAGIASLELRVAHASFCGRLVEDPGARVTVDVSGRELSTAPYKFLIKPPRVFDLAHDAAAVIVLARGVGGRLVGAAQSGPHQFRLHEIREFSENVDLLARGAVASYVADDGGCACVPGAPWLGDASGQGCDTRVVPSFDDLINTAGCELAPGAPQSAGAVCDGQQYYEAIDRRLPCFAPRPDGHCAVDLRTCHDAEGVAYVDECVPGDAAPALATSALCDAYAKAEEQACGDVIGRLRANLPAPAAVTCTLFVDPTSPETGSQTACAPWEADLPPTVVGDCIGTVLDGVDQPPFRIGLFDPANAGPRTIAPCPPRLVVDDLAPEGPAELKVPHVFHLTVGDRAVDVRIDIVKDCTLGVGLECHG
jgi:hypothetical protein